MCRALQATNSKPVGSPTASHITVSVVSAQQTEQGMSARVYTALVNESLGFEDNGLHCPDRREYGSNRRRSEIYRRREAAVNTKTKHLLRALRWRCTTFFSRFLNLGDLRPLPKNFDSEEKKIKLLPDTKLSWPKAHKRESRKKNDSFPKIWVKEPSHSGNISEESGINIS